MQVSVFSIKKGFTPVKRKKFFQEKPFFPNCKKFSTFPIESAWVGSFFNEFSFLKKDLSRLWAGLLSK